MDKLSDTTLISSFSALDLPEPKRSEYLALLGMTEDEFRANMLGHEACVRERQERAEATGNRGGLHYTDGLPAVQVDGKGEKVPFPIPDPD